MVEELHPDHKVKDFECGLDSVDDWFQTKAMNNRHQIATHVCLDAAADIGAFFALKTVIVATEGMPKKVVKDSSDGQSVGILLCQMGVSTDVQGQGHGKQLLKLAISQAVEAHRISTVQLFVVDAENESLVKFYQTAGLQLVPNTLRLVAPIRALEKALAAAAR
ncbi:GNAT family N-acetyltransferase [Arthrobacter zhaoguopingii]|uniref:GNAT family N-acetyltransferase n=1 Tax=Arthrobacter zhaoguopingii TaxID=2681491 RepID=UPI00135A86B6|nr:GNAT family N-acetyltransferase [Arthrobacter zhaoguopingii]